MAANLNELDIEPIRLRRRGRFWLVEFLPARGPALAGLRAALPQQIARHGIHHQPSRARAGALMRFLAVTTSVGSSPSKIDSPMAGRAGSFSGTRPLAAATIEQRRGKVMSTLFVRVCPHCYELAGDTFEFTQVLPANHPDLFCDDCGSRLQPHQPDNSEGEERHYQAQYAYACGYHD